MSTAIKILIGFVVLFLVSVFSIIGYVISINNTCVTMEATVKAQYKQNQNNYDNYFKTLQEAAQVPSMYMNDLKKVYDGSMSGRYGQSGSRATWQFIKEHNPTIDSSMYVKIQTIIESGRKDFENNQRMLLDKKRVYEDTFLKKFPTSFVASALGYPKIDLASMDIVTSEETEKTFKTKKSDFIKL